MAAPKVVLDELHPLRLREELALSLEQMARLLGVDARTLERWEADGELPSGAAARERLGQLREIVDLGRIVYTSEGFAQFLTAPQPILGGRTALELIEQGQTERVLGEIAGDYEGIGF